MPFLGSLSFKEYARESIVGTGIIGSPLEKAIPLLNPKPILRPVKEPGPILTAIASILLTVLFDLSKAFLTKPGSFSICSLGQNSSTQLNISPFSIIAALQIVEEVSTESIILDININSLNFDFS